MKGVLYAIDSEKCINCGECLKECPTGRAIQRRENACCIDPAICISCGHCGTVCPVGAVTADGAPLKDWKAPDIDAAKIADFLRGKRSIRRYKEGEISEQTLKELIDTASLTATATNAQNWQATILTGSARQKASETAIRFLLKCLALIDNPVGRLLGRMAKASAYTGKAAAAARRAELKAFFSGGRDPLFFRAPVLVILSYPKKEARFGKTDTALAGAHMMLHAEALGLGSCMVGFGQVAAISPKVRKTYQLPRNHRIGLIFTLGRPAVTHRRLPKREGMITTPKIQVDKAEKVK